MRSFFANAVAVVPLSDDPATPGVDPGFKLSGPGLAVDAANPVHIASLQLGSFRYLVVRVGANAKAIGSVRVSQSGASNTLGPDADPVARDIAFALGGALQIAVGLSSAASAVDVVGQWRANLLGDVLGLLFPGRDFSAAEATLPGQDALVVLSLVAAGASSGGSYAVGETTQRVDPPAATDSP